MKRFTIVLTILLSLASLSGNLYAQKIKTATAITAQDINERLSILASDSLEGRKSGESGADKAARYISGEFKRLGLAAIDSAHNYLQPFEFKEMSHDTTARPRIKTANVVGLLVGSD